MPTVIPWDNGPNKTLFKDTEDWTIEFWFKTSHNSNQVIISNYYVNTSPYSGLRIFLDSAGHICVQSVASTGVYNDNQWHHFAWTNQNLTSKVYVDGNLTPMNSLTSWITPSGVYRAGVPTYIGVEHHNNTEYFVGYLEDFRITKGIVRYNGNFTPPSMSLPNQ